MFYTQYRSFLMKCLAPLTIVSHQRHLRLNFVCFSAYMKTVLNVTFNFFAMPIMVYCTPWYRPCNTMELYCT